MLKSRFRPKYKLDVLGVGSIFGSAISTAGQMASAEYAADKQYQATKETNELNKQLADDKNKLEYQVFNEANEFNRIEAEKSRAFNEEMQTRSERFNSLTGQIAQAQQANINPAAVAGGMSTSVGASSGPAASSASVPNFTAAQMLPPDLSALQGLSAAIGNFANSQLAFSQASKTRAETEGQMTLNKWIDKEKAAGVYKDRSEASKNFAMVKQINQTIQVDKERIKEIRAKIALTNEQTFNQNVRNAFESKQMEYATKILAENLKISQVNAKRVAATLLYDILGVKLQNEKIKSDIAVNKSQIGVNASQVNLNNAKANESRVTAEYIPLEWLTKWNVSQADVNRLKAATNLLKTQNEQAAFDLGVDQDFKETMKSLEYVGSLLKIAEYFINNK